MKQKKTKIYQVYINQADLEIKTKIPGKIFFFGKKVITFPTIKVTYH